MLGERIPLGDVRGYRFDCKDSNVFVTLACESCGDTYHFKMGCHSRVCPTCNKDKSIKLIKKYRNVDKYLKNPYFVTFTIKSYLF